MFIFMEIKINPYYPQQARKGKTWKQRKQEDQEGKTDGPPLRLHEGAPKPISSGSFEGRSIANATSRWEKAKQTGESRTELFREFFLSGRSRSFVRAFFSVRRASFSPDCAISEATFGASRRAEPKANESQRIRVNHGSGSSGREPESCGPPVMEEVSAHFNWEEGGSPGC